MLFDIDNASIEEVETEETRQGKGAKSLTIVHPGKTKLHMRRAIKNVGGGAASQREVCWLCAGHNNTYVYIHDDGDKVTIVISDQDVNP